MAERCSIIVVTLQGLATYRSQCKRMGKVQENNAWFCTQHSLAKKAERSQKSLDNYAAQNKARHERWDREAYDRAAGDLCRELGLLKHQLTVDEVSRVMHGVS